MAAVANPSPACQNNVRNGAYTGSSNGGGPTKAAMGNTVTQGGLRHNPGISLEWTHEEQSILEELLAKYASDKTLLRYAKIAQALKDKTVREVVLRCRWMSKKENGKRRKDENISSRKTKERKEKTIDPLPIPQVAYSSNAPPLMSINNDDGIPLNSIGGATGQLLEVNARAMDQIFANFSNFKIQENISLFCQTRNNILSILNDMCNTQEIMRHMPPLPVKMNEQLALSILSQPPHLPNQS